VELSKKERTGNAVSFYHSVVWGWQKPSFPVELKNTRSGMDGHQKGTYLRVVTQYSSLVEVSPQQPLLLTVCSDISVVTYTNC